MSQLIKAFQEGTRIERHELRYNNLRILTIWRNPSNYKLFRHIMSIKRNNTYIFYSYETLQQWDFQYLTDLFTAAKREGIFEEINPSHTDWKSRTIKDEFTLDYQIFLEVVGREANPDKADSPSANLQKIANAAVPYLDQASNIDDMKNLSDIGVRRSYESCEQCGKLVKVDQLHAGYVRDHHGLGYTIALLCDTCRFYFVP